MNSSFLGVTLIYLLDQEMNLRVHADNAHLIKELLEVSRNNGLIFLQVAFIQDLLQGFLSILQSGLKSPADLI